MDGSEEIEVKEFEGNNISTQLAVRETKTKRSWCDQLHCKF